MSTAVIDETATEQLKRRRAIELLTERPEMSTREIAREVGMPESTLRKVKADHEATRYAVRQLAVSDVRADGGTQTRVTIDEATVERYAPKIAQILARRPMVVFFDGLHHWLADGFHRHAAAAREQLKVVACEVRTGTRRDALAYSLSANEDHGLPRSNADKRNSVMIALDDPEWRALSNAAVADLTGVSAPTVAKVREEYEATRNLSSQTVRTDRRGREIETVNLGSKKRSGTKTEDDEDDGDPKYLGSVGREPGSDDDKDEPETHEVPGDPEPDPDEIYLKFLPLSDVLTGPALETFRRDALAYRRAEKWLADGKRLGFAKVSTGEMQGAWQYLAARFLRAGGPSAWLKCSSDPCDEGRLPSGEKCKNCYGKGYIVP